MKASNPLKNLFSIVFGRTSELILTFFAITVLIRYLGSSQYGVFSSVVALLGILSKFIDLGFSQIIFREFSSNSKMREVINSAITIRLLLFFTLMLFYNIFVFFIQIVEPEEIIITNILFFNIIISAKFRNIRDLLEIPFKSKLRMDIVMFATFLDSLLLLIFILVGSSYNYSLVEITILYTLANLPGFLILIFLLNKSEVFNFEFGFKNIKWLMKESLPLWGAGILTVIFLQLDIVLLKLFISSKDAGLYSAALRIGVPLSIIPLSIVTTIFPIVVKKRNENPKLSQHIVDFSFKILLFLLLFSSIVVTFKSKEILLLLYGVEFQEASSSLILIFWSFTFYYLSQLSQNLITIIGKQKNNFYYSIILITSFLILLFFTLRSLGPTGAGLSRLISSIIGFLFLYFVLTKTEFKSDLFNFKNLVYFISLFVIAYFSNVFGLFYFLLVISISTIFLTYIFKYFNYEDFLLFNQFLKEPKWLKRFQK